MSLINKMLQELDARRPEGGTVPLHNVQVRAVPPPRRDRLAWAGAAVAGIVVLTAVAWFWNARAPIETAAVAPTPAVQHLPAKQEMPLAPDTLPTRDLPLKLEVSLETQGIPAAQPEKKPEMPAEPTSTPVVSPATSKAPAPIAIERDKERGAASTSPPPRQVDKDAAVEMPVKELTPSQMAENEYRRALVLLQQSKRSDAIAGLERALQLDPRHAASRHALVGVLIDARRNDEAMRQATEGLAADPAQTGIAMILARLQADKGETKIAIDTLEHSLKFAASRSDYHAMLAALLQRDQRHKAATEHFAAALRGNPQNGAWWMGLGISLQADGRMPEAVDAFKRAKATNTLSNELLAFVDGRLGQLQSRQ